jgi:hypothetical protein
MQSDRPSRSVDIVRSRTQATEFIYICIYICIYIYKNECLYVCLSRMRSYTIHPIAMKLR